MIWQFIDSRWSCWLAVPTGIVCSESTSYHTWYHTLVIRTTVYLHEDDKKRLAALSATSGTPEAELIRRGVRLVVAAAERPRPQIGYGRSTDRRRAADSDALLAESGFGEA